MYRPTLVFTLLNPNGMGYADVSNNLHWTYAEASIHGCVISQRAMHVFMVLTDHSHRCAL